MAGPLLQTKFHVPRRRRALVSRPRLSDRLTRGTESALTLVSAPAGFGKTTLLTEWLADWLAAAPAAERSAAWLSLDERDNDPALFWRYLVAALDSVAPGVGASALALLQSTQPAAEAVLATLLNDLGAVPNDVVLVLDDFHVIEAGEVQDGMAFLLEHLPPQIRLVIAGRADPALPLARLRGRGELVEVRAADLRFSPDEAAAYLNGVMNLALTPQDVEALEGRTEGWIAALQLAALSIQGRDDVAGFIAGFAGDDRYIVDYLAQEVLQRQPGSVRDFLLQTSILGRLNGPLCDAVTGQGGGRATLEALDRGNLFLVPLDDQRQWYRYHHLFADVLQAHLMEEQPDRIRELHRRASDWYEQRGERSEAVHHALAGEDFERAADLVEPTIPELRRNRQEATLRSWLEALPDELFRVRPVLTVGLVSSLMVRGDFDGVEARLRQAEKWLDPTADRTGMAVVDEDAFRTLPTAIAMYRAGTALVRGDVAGTMTHARRALDLADEDDHLARGAPAALLGLAYWTSGDLDESSRLYVDAMVSLTRAGYHSDVLGGSIALADMRLAQGRLREAMGIFERGLQRAERSQPVLRGAADMHVGLSHVLRERGDLDAARMHLQASSELGEHVGLPQNRYRWRVAMARIREAGGDLVGALDLLDEAERVYVGDFSPDVRPVPALRARVLVAQGRWAEALDWAQERGLSVDDQLSYLREFEHVTLARALSARYTAERDEWSIREAAALLERLRSAAEDGGRTGSLLDVLVVQSLASQAQGDLPAALISLRRALTLAEPEGYVRIFVDEGAPMASLLRVVAKEGDPGSYVRRLLAAFDGTKVRKPVSPEVIDPLSPREIDVLRLLGTDLDGPDIARRLFVSLNTVRTHTKNIYAKLGVNNRRSAVRRAEDLGLMVRPR
ncbi:LuxR C-terminal-related transcriptional regulator [Blastococcus sp. CT_GayMR16]|uniref:LuxR C-terminal-related transcriptional regulator n=1 Tax=Blastococcus sp. CT_GayMR16 TaxID=2559607 RepID=UPI0010746992|nr:LuxR C-terminal-related transcriptional regulator [Blastococcus sp. CT_GayMR16]TFV89552.1 helix-turn-helix transcriptional regulator [Blastococcus sp. CT_GayMR16]